MKVYDHLFASIAEEKTGLRWHLYQVSTCCARGGLNYVKCDKCEEILMTTMENRECRMETENDR